MQRVKKAVRIQSNASPPEPGLVLPVVRKNHVENYQACSPAL